MLTPGAPYRFGPPTDRRGVIVRRRVRDVGDRDPAADTRDDRLFDVPRAREPALNALVHFLVAAVLDGDRETGEVRGERTARQDVPVVLARVAVHRETAHRRVARVRERAKTEVIEELLARVPAADWCAALGAGLDGDGRLSGASPPAERARLSPGGPTRANRRFRLPST